MARRRTAEGPSQVEVEREASANIGKCFESDIDQFGDTACTQEIDSVEESDDDQIGKVETA